MTKLLAGVALGAAATLCAVCLILGLTEQVIEAEVRERERIRDDR